MLNKPDWDRCAERYKAFWVREIVDRPMIQVYAPKKRCSHKGTTRILDESVWKDPEPVVREMEAVFEDTYFGGDAYPMWFPNLGPGTLTACLGNPIHFDPEKDTSWQEHSVHDLASWHPHLDKANSIWQATCRLTRRIAEQARDRFVCGISDLGMGIDLLAHVRGPDGLCMDLVECPDVVISRLSELRTIWKHCYQELYGQFPAGNGSNCWLPAWAPGTTFPLQGDFTCMISPEMFAELVLPDLEAHCRWLEYPIYHLDGPNALQHLDLLLGIRELRAIQWTPGAGQPPMPHWIPMLRRIQQAGKGLFLYVTMDDIESLMAALRPEGVILHLGAPTPEIADAVVTRVAAWRC